MGVGTGPLLQLWLLAFLSALVGWGAAEISRSGSPMTGVSRWQLLVFLNVMFIAGALLSLVDLVKLK